MPPIETELPISLATWLAALVPILILLLLLVWRRWSTSAAAPLALAAAVLIAVFLFDTPAQTLAVATGKGIWDAIFVLYVIWPALILYYTAHEAGAFVAIQKGLRDLMPDRLHVVLTFAWVLSSFIQSIAGFGTPLAVTVPLLVGLGVQPVYAVLVSVIGAAWGNMFGSLGVTWFATLTVVDLDDPTTTILYTTAFLWIANLMAGLTIAWLYGRWWALKRGAPAIAVISLLHGGLQMALVPFLPSMGTFMAASAALGASLLLSRWSFYRQEDEHEPDRIFIKGGEEAAAQKSKATAAGQGAGPEGRSMSMWLAFAPYLILAGLAIIVLVIPPITNFLEQVQVGLPFPATTTGYAVERESTDSYAPFAPLTHPGTLLLVSALAGYLIYRIMGIYTAEETPFYVLRRAVVDALPATTAITAVLLISKMMDHSGEITVLALGVAAVAPSTVLVAATPIIGILGALITSSNTASNVLFAPLQETAAQASGVPESLAIAGQSAGGAIGNAIAPSDILLGTTVAGVEGNLGSVLSRAIPWTIVTGLLVSGAAVAIYLFVR